MSLFNRALEKIEAARLRKESGLLNCIPCPFPRFSEEWPGIEKGKYYLCTASSKVGKSQITDFMFLYHPIHFILNNETDLDYEVVYYSLEMSVEQKTLQAISHFLYIFHNIIISPKELRSLKSALDRDIIEKIKELEPFMDKFFSKVKFVEGIRNRYGIWLDIKNHAEKNGEIHYETKVYDGKPTEIMVGYTPRKPSKITSLIIDHASLLTPEKGLDLHGSIGMLSSNDLVKARNIFGFNPILIQQQMSQQESLEYKKADYLRPNLAGLADNKMTQRDIDFAFGLFSPARHKIPNFEGYDITKFQNKFRSIEILADREGEANMLFPLYFRGECSYFEELPKVKTPELNQFMSKL